ncbi:MAG: 16S rRNA processing protein RimM [Magnetococcales bacterium]|nr:16S rRNA processing protein RimM [Magnetococcales bacterium]
MPKRRSVRTKGRQSTPESPQLSEEPLVIVVDGEAVTSWIPVGRVVGVFGVKGGVKIAPLTELAATAVSFERVWSRDASGNAREWVCRTGHPQGKGAVLFLEGIEDRDTAETLRGLEFSIPRAWLPETEEGEFYWADLIGCRVVLEDGSPFGSVEHLFDTGANDVIVVRDTSGAERLIPFIDDVVISVEIDNKQIVIRLLDGL